MTCYEPIVVSSFDEYKSTSFSHDKRYLVFALYEDVLKIYGQQYNLKDSILLFDDCSNVCEAADNANSITIDLGCLQSLLVEFDNHEITEPMIQLLKDNIYDLNLTSKYLEVLRAKATECRVPQFLFQWMEFVQKYMELKQSVGAINTYNFLKVKQQNTICFYFFATKMVFHNIFLKANLHAWIMQSSHLDLLQVLQSEMEITFNNQIYQCGYINNLKQNTRQYIISSYNGTSFDFRFNNRQNQFMYFSLGKYLTQLATVVPNGVVVFSPSFEFMDNMLIHWNRDVDDFNIYKMLCTLKNIQWETRDAGLTQLQVD